MSRKWMFRSLLPALFLTLAIGSCEQPGAFGPEATDPVQTGLLDSGDELLDSDDDAYDGTVEGTDGQEYTLVEERIPEDIDDLTVSKLIGVDGGQLSLAGHRLTVPAGAVDEVTLFTLTLVTSGYLEVDLSAVQGSALLNGTLIGRLVEVGTEDDPFLEPVTLTLTYARSPNVEEEDEDDLIILRMLDDDRGEPLPSTRDANTKRVSTELDHFSPYCMAM